MKIFSSCFFWPYLACCLPIFISCSILVNGNARAQACHKGQPGCVDAAYACSVARNFKKKYDTPILISMVQAGRWTVEQAASMAEVFKYNCPDATKPQAQHSTAVLRKGSQTTA